MARVRDEQVLLVCALGQAVDDGVVEYDPVLVGDGRVLRLARVEFGDVVRRQSVEQPRRVLAGDGYLAHVRDVELPDGLPDCGVFLADGVELDGHLPPAKVRELCPFGVVGRVQGWGSKAHTGTPRGCHM